MDIQYIFSLFLSTVCHGNVVAGGERQLRWGTVTEATKWAAAVKTDITGFARPFSRLAPKNFDRRRVKFLGKSID